jgi:hemolysin activation/secretion protein
MLLELIFWIFVIYLAYKFVFALIIPTSTVASQMTDKMRQMQVAQQRMQQQMNQQQQQQASQKREDTPPPSKDDYIDFEEVK